MGAKGSDVNWINPRPIESRMMSSIEEGAGTALHDGYAASTTSRTLE